MANAVKMYRGSTHSITIAGKPVVKWIRGPQVHRRPAIVKWLLALGRTHDQINLDAVEIDGFKTLDAFYKWLGRVERGEP